MKSHFLRWALIISAFFHAGCFATERAVDVDTSTDKKGMNFSTHITIDAPLTDVWQSLIDTDAFEQWHPFTPHVDTTFEIDSPIVMQVRLLRVFPSLLLEQTETVSDFIENNTMCWRAYQLAQFIFNSHRCYTLEDLGNNQTRLSNTMRYEGLFWPLIGPTTQTLVLDGFEDLSLALKARLD